jgi:hypothetical protein
VNGKWIYLAQRNARLTREQFVERWLKHRTLGAPPAMGAEFLSADYAAVHAGPFPAEGISDEYDAVGLFALRGLSSIPTVARFLKLDHIQADEKRFFTTTSDRFSMFCAEKTLLDGEPTKHVVIQFLRRNQTISPYDFERRWEDQSAMALGNLNGDGSLKRYIQNVVVAPPPAGFAYDGVGEFWYADSGHLRTAAAAVSSAMRNSDFLDQRNSFCLCADIIASRPKRA